MPTEEKFQVLPGVIITPAQRLPCPEQSVAGRCTVGMRYNGLSRHRRYIFPFSCGGARTHRLLLCRYVLVYHCT